MKIALTSQNRHSITGHPGKCRRFWIYETSEKEILGREIIDITQEQVFHQADINEEHPLDGVDVLISIKMATWLEDRLAKKGTKALATTETDPDKAVQLYLEGTLPIEPAFDHGMKKAAANMPVREGMKPIPGIAIKGKS
ncbi:MAG: hypothetical protein HQL50_06040 [Magnetococcales bacterium]|nr:hypothetical protein [Magnetococcales bacterium]